LVVVEPRIAGRFFASFLAGVERPPELVHAVVFGNRPVAFRLVEFDRLLFHLVGKGGGLRTLLLEFGQQPNHGIRVGEHLVNQGRRHIRAVLADGGEHLIANPPLEPFGARQLGADDETVQVTLRDEINHLNTAVRREVAFHDPLTVAEDGVLSAGIP